ncbi:MAG TPA: SAM-dependent chlorinase/fluorinase [Aquihabitans sp.]|nr:SAM-dependent chlorinase/fluorinase [Aquihabitans sp.]
MTSYDTVSFLSDYGTVDEFVGVVHSVIHQLAPGTRVIDVGHQVPPHDVRAGGLALARAAQYLAPGVVLAVVDPGVGTARRAVAIEVGDGEAVFVGPDNGLLAPAVAMVGGATRAVELTEARYQLAAPGPTFAGRDVFGPAAAHLCAGVPLTDLGPEVDTAGLVPGIMPITRQEGELLYAEVLWTDRYGNLQLNVDPDEIEHHGDRIELRFDGRVRTGVRHGTYAEVPTGEVGLVVDSYGLVSIAIDRASAAAELGIGTGDEVVLVPIHDDGRPAGVTTTVTLREKP